MYKDYLQRSAIRPLKLHKPQGIKWVGINAYGGWDCSSTRTIPVWAEQNQSFCQPAVLTQTANIVTNAPTQTNANTTAKPESVWDVLKEDKSVPVEEAKPSN